MVHWDQGLHISSSGVLSAIVPRTLWTPSPGTTSLAGTWCPDIEILQRGFKFRVRPGGSDSKVSDLSMVTLKAAEADLPLWSPG